RPQTDRMALDVFFNIVDADGRPRPDLSLSAADIVLLSAEGIATAPVQATVRDPQTPIYVALLVDTSGSMVNAMPAVREAAKAMVDEAPSNMFISVIPFSELPETGPLTPLSSFSRDHGLVKRDIDLVEAIPNSPTCLYNAAYNAIELLEGQEPNEEERRAIILFTDGRDEVVNGQPCSRRTEDDVIARATVNRNNLTPIFTIGLREGENPRIDEALLRRLAVETNAYYAIGDRNGVSNLFREIMGYLNSQWVAHADVFPHQGINQAEIRVDIGSGIPLRETFNFLSEADHSPKAEEPVAIEPRPPVFQNSTYQLPLSIANPQGIFRLEATVTLGGRVVRNIVVQVDGNPNPIVEWPAGEDFRAGDYRVEVRGQDFNGDQICELKDDKR
ncbi:MAG: VWA domain-containing protein, partial [Caldilineaceae bacterium]|nr:VWA domain-containing protein [Caldilineaceae bacterium]